MPAKTCTFVLNPLTLFKRCVEVVDPDPPTTIPPAAVIALVIAIGALAISQMHQRSPVKAAAATTGGRSSLGEAMEHPAFIKFIVLLLLTDLTCTCIKVVLGEGEVVEYAEWIGFKCLLVFLAEQLLHLLAWGAAFFKNPWFVLDLTVVAVTMYVELNEEALEHLKIVNVLRLWKLGAFVFDLALVEHEYAEAKEKEEEEKKDK